MGDEADWIELFNNMMDQRDEWKYENDRGYDYDDWLKEMDVEPTTPHNIIFNAGTSDEMLKITEDGFYVRGVKVEQGPGEAEAVYKAFKEFMTWAVISRPVEE